MKFAPARSCHALALAVSASVAMAAASQADPVLEAEFAAQARHIAALQEMLADLHEREARMAVQLDKLDEVREKIARLDEQVLELRREVARADAEVETAVADFSEYRSEYRKWVRIAAVGEQFPALVVADGKTYEEVVVRCVTDAGLEITHATGATRVRHNDLPADIRDRFQWDAEEAAALLAQEAVDHRERERLYALAESHAKEKREAAARESAREAADARIARLERQLAAVQSSVSTSRLGSSGSLGDRRPVGRGTTRSRRYYDDDYYDRSRPTIYYTNRTVRPPQCVTRSRLSIRERIRNPVSSIRTVRGPTPVVRPVPPRRCP